MTEIAIGTQPRALSARVVLGREDIGWNKEKKGGIIDGEWEWECSERMEGMKWRRCLIHFESKGGGLEERDNPFHPGSSQWRQDQTFSHAPLHPAAAAAEPLNVRLSLPPSLPFCQPRDNIQSGKNLFRSVDLLLNAVAEPKNASGCRKIHTLPDQRRERAP